MWSRRSCLHFGKNFRSFSCSPILLNNAPLKFVQEWKYLGITLKSDNGFSCFVIKSRAAFYRSCNSVFSVLNGPSELVQMKLLYSVCVPIVTYACDVVTFHGREIQSLNVAVNDAIRRIFSYNRWESIKALRESFGYSSLTEIFAKRKLSFEKKLSSIGNTFLSTLCTI